MPNISGIETAKFLNDKYRDIDVIFITGHTEYAMVGHKLHCSSFVTKPFDENDIAEALKWLRNPIKSEKVLKVRCGGHFAVFADNKPSRFDRRLTYELFAYLIYKNGAFATNGEIITVFWGGNVDKQALLRKHIKDMRDCFGLSYPFVGGRLVLNNSITLCPFCNLRQWSVPFSAKKLPMS